MKRICALALATMILITTNASALTCVNSINTSLPMKFVIKNQTTATFNYTGTYVNSGDLSGGALIKPGTQATFEMTGNGFISFVDLKNIKTHTYFHYNYGNQAYLVRASNLSSKYTFSGLCIPDGNMIVINDR